MPNPPVLTASDLISPTTRTLLRSPASAAARRRTRGMSAIPWGKIVLAMFVMMAIAYTAPAALDGVRMARSQGAVAAAAERFSPPADLRPTDYFPAQFPPPQGQPEEPIATF